ncbi:LysM peptidoglycan-binding domain-containing protein [Brevibacillus laterosporus]|uniref:LysM peptidoglycan-binding domain-containing protein n=1 Tax=Brevibacillus laterosporus TaxID=1465 RepID=A0AAP3DKI1_BRELA|nr:LysM peptidoglycan-binding domain-containing protein [Brevibacillus laterosporus]MCR8981575.1 LysM peptidoglycan-binding domain-containing protein [Brevibacillus laterosporus]MCZ0808730.1 LysM peptidoglycan-binding domain-containing protein [Brevibacillus laterosporus]MCZ0827297.1 LysM peptidoglycan-binding domain-containing protein [Brevibacillus laterosporus]MCZ0851053.1 LysM peptidoglycan-binding domain-containing protein [Brevibacillus laterosporus]
MMMSLSFNNQAEAFLFPVLPPEIEMSDGQNSKTYTTLGLGEINVIKASKLTDIKFSSEFPNQHYPYVVRPQNLRKPNEYKDMIIKWKESERPVRFIYTGQSFDINMAVSIESFVWKEVAGSGGDIEFTMTLKKYKFYAARKAETIKTKDASGKEKTVVQKKPAPRPTDKQPPNTHKIAKGDSLWVISKKAYGKGDRWREIQKLNGLTDAQAKRLKVGTTLKLPS